ncbi:MAG: bifunctional adenosylcobinamide kinase/adenosylcobinamide-phosphate guanylyltransferase [Betaproteobacteria bacterium HGW-Betaproteobacteria-1]|jgi:adenosylcobinamide kinase/adenosylcobinamide-phosphate guanylyltransferase|nr:MAG: bifunctional adenosylcobinamide kinase/adenosylcobinamide-phosphate guanylyltransferase [Betaproteobacteria bacterium HGW-Betaproteobacteria-1]
MSTTLILGGARSGKSAYAEQLAKDSGLPVTYIATAQVYDSEFSQRIAHHRNRRPVEWQLVEEPFFLADTIKRHASPDRCLLVDCLTLWLAQWICDDCHPPQDKTWEAEQQELLDLLPTLPGNIILVSNEVGMGIVPLGEINRRFQDAQGRLNQAVAALSQRTLFMAAGLPLQLK